MGRDGQLSTKPCKQLGTTHQGGGSGAEPGEGSRAWPKAQTEGYDAVEYDLPTGSPLRKQTALLRPVSLIIGSVSGRLDRGSYGVSKTDQRGLQPSSEQGVW